MKVIQAESQAAYLVIGYFVLLIIFVFFSLENYSIISRLLAWVLFVVGTLPGAKYLMLGKLSHIPVIELILISYANAFSLPIFFQDKQEIMVKTLFPNEEPVELCLMLALLAVVFIRIGFKLAPAVFVSMKIPQYKLNCGSKRLFTYAVILCLLSLGLPYIPSSSLQGLINLIAEENLGVAIMAILYYKGSLAPSQKLIMISLIALIILKGMAIGMAKIMFMPLLIWYISRFLVTRKFEFTALLLAAVLFVLIQPVKLEYRNLVWSQSSSISSIVKVNIFATLFYRHWFESRDTIKVVESTYSRTSLLLQTAHVIDWTPNIVEYRNGETLAFMFVTLIPRFIWQDKPIAQQANIDFAIDYGLTTEAGTKVSMFGVGHLGEVYMNFGVIGIFPIFLIIGLITYLPFHILTATGSFLREFRSSESSEKVASTALLLVLTIKFMFIGSVIADSYGPLIQLLLIQSLLLYYFAGVKIHRRY